MSVIRDRIEDLRHAIQSWIEFATDYEFIDDDQFRPGPVNRAYFTYSIVRSLSRNAAVPDALQYNKDTDTFEHVGIRNATVSIKSRGLPERGSQRLLRGSDMLAELEWTLDKPEVRDIFERHGVTIVAVEAVVETSEVEENTLMPRAAMDLRVAMTIIEESTVTNIESFDLSGELLDSDGEVYEVDSFNIQIPGGE